MARVLLTGMAGAGKTTVLEVLRQRSFVTVDTDYGHREISELADAVETLVRDTH